MTSISRDTRRITSREKQTQSVAALRNFNRYPSYRHSGVDWLGDIPKHWEVKRLRSTITSCQNGVWGDEPDGISDIACVRVADFNRISLSVDMEEPTMRSLDPALAAARGLRWGNLLVEKSGGGENQPVGSVVLFEHQVPAVCSNFVARVTIAPGHDPKYQTYLHAVMYAHRINTRHIKQSTGIQNLDSSSYFCEIVGLPPEREQRDIASFLDRETGRIDQLVARKERLIELLQEQRTTLISRAVTKGVDANVPTKDSGIEWLGEIPAHWEVHRVATVATKITNGFVGPTRDILVNDGVRYLQSLHIKRGSIDFERRPYFVSPEWSSEHGKSALAQGDVLIVQTGDIGQVAVVPNEFAGCNCHALIIIRLSQNIGVGEWLATALQSHYGQGALLWSQTGALHPHLECGHVREIRIAFPPPAEQRMILQRLTETISRTDGMIAKIHDVIDRLKELRTALMFAAITGKIDVREEAA